MITKNKKAFAELVTSVVGASSVLSFCRGDETLALSVRGWMKGKVAPHAPRIAFAASVLGVTERDVAMSIYGCESQQAVIDKINEDRNARSRNQWRNRYHNDPNYRERYKERGAKRVAEARAKRIADGRACDFTRWQCGLMSKEEEAEYLRTKRRQPYRYNIGGELLTCRQLIQRIGKLSRMARALELRLNTLEAQAKMPWRVAGYRTRDEWAQTGGMASEWGRLYYQTKKHQRRAKRMHAGGAGVSPDQWWEIMRQHEYRCAYCGVHRNAIRSTSGDLEMDHVVPMPMGRDEPDNILPACKSCNSSKSTSDLMVWAAKKGMPLSQAVIDVYNKNMELTDAKG
jgi:5-methylcytosine-specific restriction endonuclease McrA